MAELGTRNPDFLTSSYVLWEPSMDSWGPLAASITGRQVQLEWGLNVTFKSVGTVNRSDSIGAIDMPILSLEGNYNGGAGGH